MKTFLICLYLSLEHSAYNLFSFQYHHKVIIKSINSCFMTLRVYWIVQSLFFLNSPTGLSCAFCILVATFITLFMSIFDCHCADSIPVPFILPPWLRGSLFKLDQSRKWASHWYDLEGSTWRGCSYLLSFLGHPVMHQACLITGPCTWCSLSGCSKLGFMWHILFYYSILTLQHLSLLENCSENRGPPVCSRRVKRLVGFHFQTVLSHKMSSECSFFCFPLA